jgi:hypothetical protein
MPSSRINARLWQPHHVVYFCSAEEKILRNCSNNIYIYTKQLEIAAVIYTSIQNSYYRSSNIYIYTKQLVIAAAIYTSIQNS